VRIFGLVVLLVFGGVTVALAHRFEHPKVLRIGVQAERLVIAWNFDVNPGPDALRTRGLFDRDADGRLDDGERKKLEKYLLDTTLLFLRIRIDGAAVDLTGARVEAHRMDRPAADDSTLGISALVTVPRPAGAFELVVEDRDKDATKHVPVVVDLAVAEPVALASQGELDPAARRIHGIRLERGRPFVLRLGAQP
jgi:hypothetical protein